MKKLFNNVYVWLLLAALPLVAYGLTKMTSVVIENSTFSGGSVNGSVIQNATISASNIATSPIGLNGGASTGNFTSLTANTLTGTLLNSVISGAAISASTINATPIGQTTPSVGIFNNLRDTGGIGSVTLPYLAVTTGICLPTTSGSIFVCAMSVPLGTSLPDTNYFADCSGSALNGAVTNITISQVQKATSSLTLHLVAATAPSRTYDEVDCIILGS